MRQLDADLWVSEIPLRFFGPHRRRGDRTPMRRWPVVMLALLAAAGAIYLLLSSPEPDHDPIDAESRAKLREVIRQESGD